MLEIIDHSVPIILKAIDLELDDSNIIYAEKSFALRLRQEKLAQILPQNKNLVPFVSYFRQLTGVKADRYNQRLNKIGIPFDKNSSLDGRTIFTPVQPVKVTYEAIFWEKDAVRINKWIKEWFSRFDARGKLQNITVIIDDSVSYKLTVQLSDPVDAFTSGTGKDGARDNFPNVGQLFMFKFKIGIIGAIPDLHTQITKFRIESVSVNYDFQKEFIKQEFTVDTDGKVTKVL